MELWIMCDGHAERGIKKSPAEIIAEESWQRPFQLRGYCSRLVGSKQTFSKDPLWMDNLGNQSVMRRDLINDAPSPGLLWACSKNKDLQKGIMIHNDLQEKGLINSNHVDALITLYSKCGELGKAQKLLDLQDSSNVIPWNSLIAGYVRSGKCHKALLVFEQMQDRKIIPNYVTYGCILKACAASGNLDKGKKIHDEISREGLLEHHIGLGGVLVDMYAKCGALQQAQSVLKKLPTRNALCWNALISGYAQSGQGQQAWDCFEQMQIEGVLPTDVTYVSILKACGAIGALDKGKIVHDEILSQHLLDHHVVLGGAVVDMYAKCGALHQAEQILTKLPSQNVVCWNALITGYVKLGEYQQALDCFEQMKLRGMSPNAVTYGCILQACAGIGALEEGKKVHDEILKQKLLSNHVILRGALVDMYSKCGALSQAQRVLEELPSRDVVSWGALIAGYAQNGQGHQALDCFKKLQSDGILPNDVIYGCVLRACGLIRALDKGKEVHDEISKQGLLEHHIVLGGALVDMYAKCDELHQARSVLEKLPSRNVVAWGALIAGYIRNGQDQEALDCFEQMQTESILPDEVTFCLMLNVCSHLGLVEKGQELFDNVEVVYGLKPSLPIFACMVDLLGRAGHLMRAVEVIQGMPMAPDIIIWHSLLGSCWKWADVDLGTWAFKHVVELDKRDGAHYVTMINIYTAAGLIKEAKEIEAMRISNRACNLPG